MPARAWMSLIWLGLAAVFGTAPAAAQDATSVTVSVNHPQARFRVDGREYTRQQVFLWPNGSTHIVEFFIRADGFQYTDNNTTRFEFGGWKDNKQLLSPTNERIQAVTVAPGITSITATVTAYHQANVQFFGDLILVPYGTTGPGSSPAVCGAPGPPLPADFRAGVVYIDGICYWNSVQLFLQEGRHVLNAFPYPGFAFQGWAAGSTPANEYVRDFNIVSPLTLIARFTPAKRVSFRTEPQGFRVSVDRVDVQTSFDGTCDSLTAIPPGAPATIRPLCRGDFDFAPNSRHVVGAPSPQNDIYGKLYVFGSFSNNMPNHSLYEVGNVNTNNNEEIIIAKFVRGVSTQVVTKPSGLKLRINDRDNWATTSFVFAVGSKQFVSAPAEQTDSRGRKYVFKGWSNGGPAAQEVTVPDNPEAVFHLEAEYELLSQVVLRSNPLGGVISVDGQPCSSPCTVDRKDGTEVMVSATERVPQSDVHRLEFVSWSNGGERDQMVTVSGAESKLLVANYRTAFRLGLGTEPAGGGKYLIDPPASDGFYPADTYVSITAEAEPGFKFRRWDGDLAGTFSSTAVIMAGPRNGRGMFDRVPYIAPAGIRNSAGERPDPAVAGGSLVSILGQNLAAEFVPGPVTPLSQTLGSVSVVVGAARILPLVFVAPEQIDAQIPYDLEPGEHKLSVRRAGQQDVNGTFTVSAAAPGLFHTLVAGQPMVQATRPNGSFVSASNQARRGEEITLTGTGFGRFQIGALEGFAFPSAPNYNVAGKVEVIIADQVVEPVWSRGLPGEVGKVGVRFRVPDNVGGPVSIKVRMGSSESNQAILPVEALEESESAEAGEEPATPPQDPQ